MWVRFDQPDTFVAAVVGAAEAGHMSGISDRRRMVPQRYSAPPCASATAEHPDAAPAEGQLARTGWRAQTFWYDFVCHVAIGALGLKLSMGVIVPTSTMAKKGSSVEIELAGVMRRGAVSRIAWAARALRAPFRRQAAA